MLSEISFTHSFGSLGGTADLEDAKTHLAKGSSRLFQDMQSEDIVCLIFHLTVNDEGFVYLH
jgi:hypothetical protein